MQTEWTASGGAGQHWDADSIISVPQKEPSSALGPGGGCHQDTLPRGAYFKTLSRLGQSEFSNGAGEGSCRVGHFVTCHFPQLSEQCILPLLEFGYLLICRFTLLPLLNRAIQEGWVDQSQGRGQQESPKGTREHFALTSPVALVW